MINIFLSSTGRDLQEYRDTAYKALNRLPGFHCTRMEDFVSANSSPLEVCLERVADCNVFVGIVGHLYGDCPPNDDKSFTEHEYDAASNKPRLMFVVPREFPIPGDLVEADGKRKRQTKFRNRVLKTHYVEMEFKSPDELAWLLLAALANLLGLSRMAAVITEQHQEYDIVVERSKTTETRQIEIGPDRIFELTPTEGERHVRKVTATPVGGGTPYVFDFRGGDLPPLASLTRDTGGSYRLQDGGFSFAEIGEPRFEEIEPGVRALLLSGEAPICCRTHSPREHKRFTYRKAAIPMYCLLQE